MKLTLEEAERLAYIGGKTQLAQTLAIAIDQGNELMAVESQADDIIATAFTTMKKSINKKLARLKEETKASLLEDFGDARETAEQSVSNSFGHLGVQESLDFKVRRHV